MIDNANSTINKSDILFLGLPFYSTCGVRGCGPKAIREALNSLSSFNLKTMKDSFDVLKIKDYGDVKAVDYNSLERKVDSSIKSIYSKGFNGSFIFMGGEHLVTLPLIKSLSKRSSFNCLILDAHADFYDKYKGSKFSYATVTRRVSELVDKVYIAGVRDLSLEEFSGLKDSRVKMVDFNEASRLLKRGSWYVSVDLDVLDPIYCPCVSTPVPLGLKLIDLVKLLNTACLSRNMVALDIVELTSRFKDLSAVNTAGLIINYLHFKGGELSK